ncbi:MAG: alpha/beta hydrolase, partial [Planctomycetota bacterium]
MFVITNRDVDDSKRGFAKFGDVPNRLGANELRIVEASKTRRAWRISVLPDVCTPQMKRAVGITDPGKVYCSEYVAEKLRAAVAKGKRHVLLYVHGFNNDMKDVLEQTEKLRQTYQMEVIAFSWPAKGGGAVTGTLSYRRD